MDRDEQRNPLTAPERKSLNSECVILMFESLKDEINTFDSEDELRTEEKLNLHAI